GVLRAAVDKDKPFRVLAALVEEIPRLARRVFHESLKDIHPSPLTRPAYSPSLVALPLGNALIGQEELRFIDDLRVVVLDYLPVRHPQFPQHATVSQDQAEVAERHPLMPFRAQLADDVVLAEALPSKLENAADYARVGHFHDVARFVAGQPT